MKSALVIGGTGMLAELTKRLSDDFDIVGVIGRTPAKMQAVQTYSRKIMGLLVDYSNVSILTSELDHFIGIHGRPGLVVSWIHSTSPDVPLVVASYCDGDFYDVTGHDGAQLDHISHQREKAIRAKGITYHRVILGRNGDRWLTNQEISDGVYRAIQLGKTEFVVGEL